MVPLAVSCSCLCLRSIGCWSFCKLCCPRCVTGNAFGLSFGHEIFAQGSSCNGLSPSGLLVVWHVIAKTFVIVRAVVATDLLSCDAWHTLGSMDSAAWELGPKKLETAGKMVEKLGINLQCRGEWDRHCIKYFISSTEPLGWGNEWRRWIFHPWVT